MPDDAGRPQLSDAEWRERLGEEAYAVLRKGATEAPFMGQYVNVKAAGEYRCAGCDALLFDAAQKYDSQTGWPSFWDVARAGAVRLRRDWSMLLPRTEVRCARCDGHLGHVFGDGPEPTGKRYCVNSAALKFRREAPVRPPGRTAAGA